jgi:hypothetical protein
MFEIVRWNDDDVITHDDPRIASLLENILLISNEHNFYVGAKMDLTKFINILHWFVKLKTLQTGRHVRSVLVHAVY